MRDRGQFLPKKSLGQNFLVNPSITQRIIDACDLKPTDTVLEIGPGKGALTKHLSRYVKKVLAVEKDNVLAKELAENFTDTNIEIVHADILQHPFETLPDNVKIVGNLPYNIATPIIEKALEHRKKFCAFYMTVQLEYGQRMAAKPDNKSYGSFSCFVQYYADIKILFKIKNSAFQPIPKVQSCFLSLTPLPQPRHKAENEEYLFKIIRACFGQRRKTIQNSLASMIGREASTRILQSLGINPKLRAENLSLNDYVQIANSGPII